MSVAECQERVSAREFTEWCALMAVEPWGALRDDLRMAQLTAMVANMFRGEDDEIIPIETFIITPDEGEIDPLDPLSVTKKAEAREEKREINREVAAMKNLVDQMNRRVKHGDS
jgi:F420-0:gamma-glutamyl ligase